MAESPPIDLLALFSRFGREQKLSLRDAASHDAFLASAREALGSAVNNDTLMHGQRTENMFAALVVSLGHYKLLNREDSGAVRPLGQFQAPDFRVVMNDGNQWLVEVKNFFDAEPGRQVFDVTAEYLARLQSYSDVMRCPLKLAIYWARWRIWTLIEPSDLEPRNGRLAIDVFKAARVNQLAALGDRTIGTTPPLKFRLLVDTEKPREIKENGEVAFTIARAAFYSGEEEITDPAEQQIAWMLADLGDWECEGPLPHISDGKLNSIELMWAPRERSNSEQDFEMIGTLSTMYSRHYATQTLNEQGVVQTEAEVVPGWFAPLVASNLASQALPLWRFILQPNRPDKAVLEATSEG
ncbi:MAG: hypothetical protein K8F62_11850 [Pseudorhodoplanes sp.]|nr:hypothetical protein [Pseudorhodoplanes sp.]